MEGNLVEVQNKNSQDQIDAHEQRRQEFFKRQDSWTGFKQRIFRVASTVVLPRNKRGSNNVCGVELKKIKEATSMKSLPLPKIDHDVTVSKSYLRSISAHNERTEYPTEEAPAAAEPFINKRKAFGFHPRTSCIREGDEDYFGVEDSETQDVDVDLKTTFKDIQIDPVELRAHSRKRPTDLLIREQPCRGPAPFTLSTKDDVLPVSIRVPPKSTVKVVDFSPVEPQIKSAKSNNKMLSSSEPFLLESQEKTRLEPSKSEALMEGFGKDLPSKSIEKTCETCNSDEETFLESEDETGKHDQEHLSYKGLYDCMPPPIFMFVITIIEVGFFIYHTQILINDPKYGHINKYSPAPLESYLIYNPTRRYELWRYFTYAFVHSGYMHIINNIVVQLLLGILLEMVHKWYRVLAIYFAGVLAGSLATSISEPFNYLAGASAGVYALIAAHVSTVILNWSEMEHPWIRVLVFLVFVCHDAGTAIYFTYVLGEKTSIGFAAHLGGAVAGLLVGIYVLRNLQWKKWEVVIWYVSIASCVLLFLFAIAWNIVRRDLFP